jgi:hypothetical protein
VIAPEVVNQVNGGKYLSQRQLMFAEVVNGVFVFGDTDAEKVKESKVR